jgi:hypothetical protein
MHMLRIQVDQANADAVGGLLSPHLHANNAAAGWRYIGGSVRRPLPADSDENGEVLGGGGQ